MKKILSVILSLMLIFSCFAVTVFAENFAWDSIEEPNDLFEEDTIEDFDVFNAKMPIGTFSDRYEKFYVDGEQYTRINATQIDMDLDYYWIVEEEYNSDYYLGNSIYIELSNQQNQEIKTVNLKSNKQRSLVEATLTYFDDVEMTIVYLKDSYLDEYNKVLNGETDTLVVHFTYPNNNKVIAQKNQLVGETVTFSRNQLADLNDDFDVIAENSDGSISAVIGKLLLINDEYYYLNYAETGLEEKDVYGNIGKLANKPAHKITDEAIIKEFDDALVVYYEDDYGVLYNDSATESISIVFFIFVFAVVPLAILIFFLIKAIRGKGIYKKMYFTVVAVCLAEIIVFAILAGVFIKTSSDDNYHIIGGSYDDEQMLVADWENISIEEIEEYAYDLDVSNNGEDATMLKNAIYCGDGDCRDGCTTGYFYRDANCSEEDAMMQLGLGEKTENIYDHIDNAVIYQASWSENIVVNSTEYGNGYIVEYQVIGVG